MPSLYFSVRRFRWECITSFRGLGNTLEKKERKKTETRTCERLNPCMIIFLLPLLGNASYSHDLINQDGRFPSIARIHNSPNPTTFSLPISSSCSSLSLSQTRLGLTGRGPTNSIWETYVYTLFLFFLSLSLFPSIQKSSESSWREVEDEGEEARRRVVLLSRASISSDI